MTGLYIPEVVVSAHAGSELNEGYLAALLEVINKFRDCVAIDLKVLGAVNC